MGKTISFDARLSHYAEYWHTPTHACQTSAAQSNQSCLYMTQSVQYFWVVLYVCFYINSSEDDMWVRVCVSLRKRVCVCSRRKYVCTETKLSEARGIRFRLSLLFLDRVTSTCLFIHTNPSFGFLSYLSLRLYVYSCSFGLFSVFANHPYCFCLSYCFSLALQLSNIVIIHELSEKSQKYLQKISKTQSNAFEFLALCFI